MPKRRFKGKVVSDKMEKTVVVAVERVSTHPVYKKQIKATKRFKAHNELGAKVGDAVMIEETRPLSRQKRWQVIEVSGRGISKEPKVEKAGGKR